MVVVVVVVVQVVVRSAPGSAGSQGSFGPISFTSQGGGTGGRSTTSNITIDLSTNDLIGVHLMLYHSLGMVDTFLRKELLKNIVLAGGTSMAKGFGDRMKKELALLMEQQQQGGAGGSGDVDDNGSIDGSGGVGADGNSSASSGLNIITDSQRKYAAWIGASMYASLDTFSIIKITADQYKRDENTVHKKFF